VSLPALSLTRQPGVPGLSRSFSRSPVTCFGHSAVQDKPPTHVLFVGNLPWTSTKEELAELFGEFGEVTTVRLHTHGDGRPRGFAHVEFTTKEQAIACYTSAMEETIYFGGRDLVIDYARDISHKATDLEPNNRLYFIGCAEGEAALKDIFSAYSQDIVSIYYLRDGNTGERLPRGFIEFKSVGIATEALSELNNTTTPAGENLMLAYSRPPRPRGERPTNPRLANTRREKYTARSWMQ